MARAHRDSPAAQAPGVAYRARAEGHIYFFLDPDGGGAGVPMRVDQVAVDLYRDARGRSRQVVRAMRRKALLPIRDFRYYVDRLTAVQNGFGDRISIGEGRDVRDVPHPLARDASDLYRYRIADSVAVSVPSVPEPIRVYEVEVRPRRDDVPAFWGSVFLEASTGALARMSFTFTSASYVDPRSDRIHVRLEHGLWEGTLWLPHRQVVEVRREVPRLDLPVGSVIRAILEVTDYDFDVELEPSFFDGPSVAFPPAGTTPDSTEFRTALLDGLAAQGLSPTSPASLEAEARTWARERLVGGLPRARLHAPNASTVLRANRAEGVATGVGVSYAPGAALRLEGVAGYGWASDRAHASLGGRWRTAAGSAALEAFHRQLRDAGPRAGASGLVNSLSTLFRNRDWSDPFHASGARLSYERAFGARALRLGATWESHVGPPAPPWSSGLGPDVPRRALRPIGEGTLARVRAGLLRRWGGTGTWGLEAEVEASAGRWQGRGLTTIVGAASARVGDSDLSRRAELTIEAGAAAGEVPHQLLYFLGGRGTLPGHPFRSYGGRRYLLARAEAAQVLVPGWITARLVGGAGVVGRTPESARALWDVAPTAGVAGYLGAGVATLRDVLRVDGAWGLPGGVFEIVASIDPWLAPFL